MLVQNEVTFIWVGRTRHGLFFVYSVYSILFYVFFIAAPQETVWAGTAAEKQIRKQRCITYSTELCSGYTIARIGCIVGIWRCLAASRKLQDIALMFRSMCDESGHPAVNNWLTA